MYRKATKTKDVKEEMVQLMRKHVNWENHLMPAPYTAAILGNLIRLSLGTDFELHAENLGPIKYSNSFRATLAQLSNNSYTAFSAAHVGMDKIHINMKMVPLDFRDVLKILYRGSPKTMDAEIGVPLGAIKATASESKVIAENVEKEFEQLMDLCQAILEGCVNEQQGVEKGKREAELTRKHNEGVRKNLEKRKKREKELLDKFRGKINEADDRFQKTMEEFPTGWDMFGMDIVGGIGDALGMGASAEVTNIADGTNEKKQKRLNIIEEAKKISRMSYMEESLKELTKGKKESWTNKLKGIVKQVAIPDENEEDQVTEEVNNDRDILEPLLTQIKILVEAILEDAQKAKPEEKLQSLKDDGKDDEAELAVPLYAIQWKLQTIKMCENALETISSLESLAKQFEPVSAEQHNELAPKISDFTDEAEALAKGKLFLSDSETSDHKTKVFKEKGIKAMFQEIFEVAPIASRLMLMVQCENGKEFLKPFKDQDKILKSLKKELGEVKQKADLVSTTEKVGKGWRKACLEVAAKGQKLIEDAGDTEGLDEEQQAKFIKRIRNLVYGIGKIETIGKQQSNQPAVSQKTPNHSNAGKTTTESHGQAALEQAKQKAIEAQADIRRKEKDFIDQQKKMMELCVRLEETLIKISEAKADELNLDEIMKIIREAIKTFSDLKAQWAKIIEFFQLISALIETARTTCQKFTGYVEANQKDTTSKMRQDLTFKSAYEAVKITYLVQNMTMWYVDVSDKHILPRIARLSNVFCFDPTDASEKRRMDKYMDELNESVKVAQSDIKYMMQKGQREFLNNCGRRLNKIFDCFEAMLPEVASEPAKLALEEHKVKVKQQLTEDMEAGDDEDDEEDYGVDLADMW